MFPQETTDDGFDIQMATNHLGHFLLTEMLMPLIKKSEASGFHPRIVILSSSAHERGRINWSNFHFTGDEFDTFDVYASTKLANVMHAKELARSVLYPRYKICF